MEKNNELQVIVKESGLAENKVQELMSHFSTSFKEAHEIAEQSKGIVVTDETQVDEMAKARTARLKLKNLRVSVENLRKELKEQSLREGKAIDGAANIIKALIVPVEEHLEKQEKFAEEIEKQRKAEKIEKRKLELAQYVADISVYDLENISEETYQKLLADAKAAFEAQKAAEKKAEEQRVEMEQMDKLHSERKEQLIPYWNFIRVEERSTYFGNLKQEVFDVILKRAKQMKADDDAAQEKIRKENEELKKQQEIKDKKIAEEREAKEKAERELQAKKQADEKAKKDEEMRLEKERVDAEQAKKQAELAPDKEKMRIVYKDIQELSAKIELVDFQSEGCHQISQKAVVELNSILRDVAAAMKAL